MNNVFRRIILLITLFIIAPTDTKQMGRATIQPAPPTIQPSQPIIPSIPAPVQPAPVPVQPIILPNPPAPNLPPVQPQPVPGRNTWTSSAGLVYISTDKLPNTINHVLSHAKADPNKPTHSVFSVPENKILDLVDEAWNKRGQPTQNPKSKGDNYIIDMGRVIGTKGERKILIATSTGKSDIMTAHPMK